MKIFESLEHHEVVTGYEVLEFRKWENGFYFRIKILLINRSSLYAKEYVDEKEREYSYHWQDIKNNLITRWDNAPHHVHLISFPHHKHQSGNIFENEDISLIEILDYIKSTLKSKHS